MQPDTRYAKTADGVHIAYQVVGDGPLDLVMVSEWLTSLEGRWEEPQTAHPLRRLASFTRLISFDKRGMGCSDPVPLNELTTPEEWMSDIVTVMDEVGSERAALFGAADGGPIATLFAATYPERARSLVLAGTAARWAWAEDYPSGVSPELQKMILEFFDQGWSGSDMIELGAIPTAAADEGFRLRYGKHRRLQASPGQAAAMFRMLFALDIRHVLPTVQAPTLVIARRCALNTLEFGQYLAEHIRGARFKEFPGTDDLWWGSNADEVVDEVEEFLTGVRSGPPPDRVLATVLFTDIAGSTRKAVELGDGRWKRLLDDHHGLVRREIDRFRGREIDTAGDGFLVTFDGPARAIRCACAIRDGVRPLGIEVRAGLHTGECEQMGQRIGGIAVHIASRIVSLAEPSEVLVSRTVTDLVAGSGLQFDERGMHTLRDVPGEWQLFRAVA